MFGRRRGMWPRRRYGYGGGGGLGAILLGMQLVNLFNYFRNNEILPVTLGVVALNVVAYFQPSILHIRWPSLAEACVSVQKVWFERQWQRIFTAPFFHSGDMHLYFNLASFVWKGISLEKKFGSGYFLYMIGVFSVATNVLYVAINWVLAELLDQWSFVQSCAVGFSGVIFALKVVTTHLEPPGMTRVMGMFPMPMRLACWAELVLISVLFPHVSFVGHLSGILVGLAFVSGPLRAVMDLPLSFLHALLLLAYYIVDMAPVPGRRQAYGRSYTYRAATTGHQPPGTEPRPADSQPRRSENPPHNQRSYSSYTYAAGSTGYGDRRDDGRGATADHHGHLEEEGLREAIRRSLENTGTYPATSSQIPVTNESDVGVQLALERSMADASNRQDGNGTGQQDTDVHSREGLPTEDTVEENPSGYGFCVSELQSTETLPIGGREEDTSEHSQAGVHSRVSQPPDSLRRRHIGPSTGGSSIEPGPRDSGSSIEPGPRDSAGGVLGQEPAALSREALRAARLQRLAGGGGRGQQQRSRVPLNSISATLRNSPLNKK